MGNCCLQQFNTHQLTNSQALELPPIHHNQHPLHHNQHPLHQQHLQPQYPHSPIHLKTIDNSQIILNQHLKDNNNTHQTTNNSILIPDKSKTSLTVSACNKLGCSKEEINSTTSIVLPTHINSHPLTDQQLKELQFNRQQFLNSNRLFHGLNKSTDVARLLELAQQANQLNLHLQQKSIYMRCITYVDLLKNKYSQQSVEQTKAYIYRQLTKIAITMDNQPQADTFMLRAIQAYRHAVRANTIEQHIELINNYAVYKVECNRLEEGKKYLLMGIELMNEYYSVEDDRKYMAMVSLACIEYDRHHYHSGDEITRKINMQCSNEQIRQLAATNHLYYTQPPQP